MLGPLEGKLTSQVADALGGRAGLLVLVAPLPLAAPDPGSRTVRVSLDELLPDSRFETERTVFIGESPTPRTRRVARVGFTAKVRATARPAQEQPAEISAARRLLMEDLSLIVHALDRPGFRNGHDLAGTEADPGYDVLEFELAKGSVVPDLVEHCVAGELEYRGVARIWPPGVSDEGGEIRIVDKVMEPLPVEIHAAQPVVSMGRQTVVRVRVGSRLRSTDGAGTTAVQLAATVLGDAPPAERGSLVSGTAAADPRFRLHAVGEGPTEITYAAPTTGVTRPRTEYVAVHLAAANGAPGVFLGSTPVRVVPGAPP